VVTDCVTEVEAHAMAEEAIRLVLEYRIEHGIEIAADAPPPLRRVTIAA
jgi:predicted RNase H-like HicB family nuclease